METYTLILDKHDQHLIDTVCMYPNPAEAFAFEPLQDGRVQVSTIDKKRFETWVRTLNKAKKIFEQPDIEKLK